MGEGTRQTTRRTAGGLLHLRSRTHYTPVREPGPLNAGRLNWQIHWASIRTAVGELAPATSHDSDPGWKRNLLELLIDGARINPRGGGRAWRVLCECALDEFADQMEVVDLCVAAFGDGTHEAK